MRYLALCTDYDGTLAHHGKVDAPTIAALEKFRASGRKLVLVTGRELPDLQRIFERLDLFDRVVVENGALIYRPASREERLLCDPPPPSFIEALRKRGVNPSIGRSIVATWHPHEGPVLETIRDMGLELQVIFNKGAVMILPGGVNKATGLKVALDELNVSIHNTVAVGDAENDHAMLNACECSAAVDNALPSVKEKVDIVLPSDHGAGVTQLIEEVLSDDLANRTAVLQRHAILLGKDERGTQVTLPPFGVSALVVGTSGGGKSTVASGLIERLRSKDYSFCIIDPEGDYDSVEGAAVLGNPERAPSIDECMQLLSRPNENAVINLLGIKLSDRPAFFMSLLARIRELRAKTGRPHWLIVDEAHHVLPADWQTTELVMPKNFDGRLLISVTPSVVARSALELVETLIVIGERPREMVLEFADANSLAAPDVPLEKIPRGQAVLWHKSEGQPEVISIEPTKSERRRHVRKYSEGSLGEDRSFYFRGPQGKLNLRAQNLMVFLDLADGVDEETWLHHWQKGDVTNWLRTSIKDDELTAKIAAIEHHVPDDAAVSRKRVRDVIEESYTLPAEGARAQ